MKTRMVRGEGGETGNKGDGESKVLVWSQVSTLVSM